MEFWIFFSDFLIEFFDPGTIEKYGWRKQNFDPKEGNKMAGGLLNGTVFTDVDDFRWQRKSAWKI